jgi:3-hydroxybutyryl-CoA dehydratase
MNESSSGPACFEFFDIHAGMKRSHDYVITPRVYEQFLDAFQDHSPVHVDEIFARSCGFSGKVMHGSLLNGFISHFVGMHFPGKWSLLLSVDLRFSNPSFLGDTIQMVAVVQQKMEVHKIVVLDATLTNITRNCIAARGRIQVMVKGSE